MDKQGMSDGVVYLLIALIAVGILQSASVVDIRDIFGSTAAPPGGGDGNIPNPLVEVCSDPSNTMTVGPLKSAWNPTTSMSAQNVRVYESGKKGDGTYASFSAANDKGSKADSSTLTVAYNDKIGVVNGIASTVYHTSYATFFAPCVPFSTGDQDSSSNQLVTYETAITFSAFQNEDGLKNDGNGNNETIGAGEIGGWDTTKLLTDEKTGFYPIAPGREDSYYLAVLLMNGSTYKEEDTSWSGSMDKVATPAYSSVTYLDDKAVTFKFAGCPNLIANSDVKYCNVDLGVLRVQADSGKNPTQVTEALGDDIRISWYGPEWYQHTITGEPLFGDAKNDGTRAGFASQTTTLHVT